MALCGPSFAAEELAPPQIFETEAAQPAIVLPAAEPADLPQLNETVSEVAELSPEVIEGFKAAMQEGLESTNLAQSSITAIGAPNGAVWLEASQNPLCRAWDAYCVALDEKPLFTKVITGMVGAFLGDLVAQLTAESAAVVTTSSRGGGGRSKAPFRYEFGRAARLMGYSAVVGTPMCHYWFNFLESSVLPTDPTCPLAVFVKVGADQMLMTPVGMVLFFVAMKLMEGRPGDVRGTLDSKLRPSLLANWTVWPLAQLFNFTLVPPAQRILYVNLISIAWTAYMSHIANDPADAAVADVPEAVPVPATAAGAAATRPQQRSVKA